VTTTLLAANDEAQAAGGTKICIGDGYAEACPSLFTCFTNGTATASTCKPPACAAASICDGSCACAASGTADCGSYSSGEIEFCLAAGAGNAPVDVSGITPLSHGAAAPASNTKYCIEDGSVAAGKKAKICSATEFCNTKGSTASALCVAANATLARGAAQAVNGTLLCLGNGAAFSCNATEICNPAGTSEVTNTSAYNGANDLCLAAASVLADGAQQASGGVKICIGNNYAEACAATYTCETSGTNSSTTCIAPGSSNTTAANVTLTTKFSLNLDLNQSSMDIFERQYESNRSLASNTVELKKDSSRRRLSTASTYKYVMTITGLTTAAASTVQSSGLDSSTLTSVIKAATGQNVTVTGISITSSETTTTSGSAALSVGFLTLTGMLFMFA
jgi:hypothetical protein